MIHTVDAPTWKKLSPAQQAIFREESTSAGDLMRKLMTEGEADQIKKREAAGMQITRPDLAPSARAWIRPTSGRRVRRRSQCEEIPRHG